MIAEPGMACPLDGEIATPPLTAADIHVWTIGLNDAIPAPPEATAMLDESERTRAASFVFERDRALFIRRRSALRRILGGYLGLSPADVVLRSGARGKPALGLSQERSGLHFNVSNSAGVALCAVTRSGPIGVDVEQIRPMADLDGVAGLVLGPAERAVFDAREGAEKLALFHAAWTRKEAYLKARGEGLMRSPTLIEFGALLGQPEEPIRDADDPGAGQFWRIWAWHPMPGYSAALVAKPAAAALMHRRFSA